MRNHPCSTNRPRWNRLRLKMLDKANWRCRKCGKAGRMELDHIQPVAHGGKWWTESNLMVLCRECHFLKTGAENRLNSAEREAWADIVATETVKVLK